MSATAGTAAAAAASNLSPSSSSSHMFTGLGLGFTVAITLGFLVLLSAILLASYICCRAHFRHRSPPPPADADPNPSGSGDGVFLPRIIFVAEDDDDDDSAPAPGLDQAIISSYPKFPYSAGKAGDVACAICLCEYREAEMLRMLPDCRHSFHLLCVDAWLRLNASCPVCRSSPMPTPLSTPLSELVPLSQFPADRRRR